MSGEFGTAHAPTFASESISTSGEPQVEDAELDAKLDDLSSTSSAVEKARLDIESKRKTIETPGEKQEGLGDEIGTTDSDPIAALVDYLGDYVEYLVVVLLLEDAGGFDDDIGES